MHDNAGNLLTDVRSGVTTAYTYNKRNRLATVTVGGNLKGTYTYNAREQLVKRVLTNMTPSGTTHFVHDLMGNVIAETNGVATGTVREYIWLPETEIAPVMAARAQVDRPLAVVDAVNTASPVTWWVHPDHLNRPAMMTDAAKAQVWQAVWKPFGDAQSITGPAALDTRFPGQWFQIESGLHYNWHRHYDPTTGRYTQPDPLGFVDGPGVYGYTGQNPAAHTDRKGLEIWVCNAEDTAGTDYDGDGRKICRYRCQSRESWCHKAVIETSAFSKQSADGGQHCGGTTLRTTSNLDGDLIDIADGPYPFPVQSDPNQVSWWDNWPNAWPWSSLDNEAKQKLRGFESTCCPGE